MYFLYSSANIAKEFNISLGLWRVKDIAYLDAYLDGYLEDPTARTRNGPQGPQ